MTTCYVYVYWLGIDGGSGTPSTFSTFAEAWKKAQWLLSPSMGYGKPGKHEVVIRVKREPVVTRRSLLSNQESSREVPE